MAGRFTTFFLIFTISGFSGLIYESIWSQYIKLFLGHAAYGQALVLAIFMGGLSLGSWICSRYSRGWRNLLKGYALTEGSIGVLALLFHPVFDRVVTYSYTTVIPALNSPAAVTVFTWTVSAALILPASILLGMTFPLMSAALLRSVPDMPGRTLSMLYFTNSLGAAVGVLISGFFLVRTLGLPGTLVFAALINCALAIVVWRIADEGLSSEQSTAFPVSENSPELQSTWRRFLLFASLVTGAASFIYEIGWIRMLSLVLGSSTDAFELMLSAFIAGLAFGGFWIQRRLDSFRNPVRVLMIVQVAMGLLALATLPLYGNVFGLLEWMILKLPKTGTGYQLFNLSSHLLALAIMLPATFCAGMTLPLITVALIRQGSGEESIGAVYSMNTIGAIAGVFFAIHLGMPLLGLKGLIIIGAVLDIGLGLLLLPGWGNGRARHPALFMVPALCVCALCAAVFLVRLDPYKMASGVYRTGHLLKPGNSRVIFQRDGKTATVTVTEHNDGNGNVQTTIRTNGKPDAAISADFSAPCPDEITMILLGVLPLAYHPDALTAAAIGFGSGLTSRTLLLNPRLKAVDTIEIEEQMVEGARNFGRRVHLVYQDPRSRIYIDDAKTYFSSRNKKYDIIVSEPSNPWVSGVATLFSGEFYRLIGRHLNEKGLFVQWVQLYEIDLDLVASVFKAMGPHFSDFAVYTTSGQDLLIIAKKAGDLGMVDPSFFSNPPVQAALRRIHIQGIQDIETRRIGDKKMLMPFFESFPVRANSDYYPVLDQNAARARFVRASAEDLVKFSSEPLPLVEMLSTSGWYNRGTTQVTLSDLHSKTEIVNTATAVRDYLLSGNAVAIRSLDAETRTYAEQARGIFYDCGSTTDRDRKIALFNTAKNSIPYLSPAESSAIWKKLGSGPCADRLSPIEQSYVSLFKAVGERNGRKMAGAAQYLLDHEPDISSARLKYTAAAGMLGNLAAGDREGSEAIWSLLQNRTKGTARKTFLFYFLETETFASRYGKRI